MGSFAGNYWFSNVHDFGVKSTEEQLPLNHLVLKILGWVNTIEQVPGIFITYLAQRLPPRGEQMLSSRTIVTEKPKNVQQFIYRQTVSLLLSESHYLHTRQGLQHA